MPNGNGAYIRLPTLLTILALLGGICLGATGYVASEQAAHARGAGHADTRERLGRLEEHAKSTEQRLGRIEQQQEKTQEQIRDGFQAIQEAIRNTNQ